MKPPILQIELISPTKLKAYGRNARTHSKQQVVEIAQSIQEFGWTNPILIAEENEIIAGHGRLEAARFLKLKQVPCIQLLGLTDQQKRALRIADNKLALNAGWDNDLLREEIAALQGEEYDISVLGFNETELERLALSVEIAGRTDPDSLPPAADTETITKPGDLWMILGEHRVLCGDATSRADVRRLLDGRKPNVMVTDPPYGVNYDATWRETAGLNQRTRQGSKVLNDNRVDWTPAWILFTGAIAYVWHAGVYSVPVAQSLESAGFRMRAQIIWRKQHFVIGRGAYHWQHEPAWFAAREGEEVPWLGDNYSPDHEDAFYGVREGNTANWMGNRKQSTVWEAKNLCSFGSSDDVATGHSTQKPVEIMRRPLLNHTAPGALVYDPFLGSGTTVIAAETCGRICVGLELSPKHVDLIVRRWEAFTGREATRQVAVAA